MLGSKRRSSGPSKGWRGSKRTFWLQPEATFRLLKAASDLDAEFGIFCTLLNYCGLRLSEALGLECETIELDREYAYIPTTKTDEPRAVYLPPIVVAALANHPRGLDRKGRVFRFHNGGWLRGMLDAACEAAGVVLPHRTAFHVFRHNYGTWLRLYGGLDAIGLTRTGAWADLDSVERYAHSEPTAEARRAAMLPTQAVERTWRRRRKPAKTLIIRNQERPSHGRGRRFNPYSAHIFRSDQLQTGVPSSANPSRVRPPQFRANVRISIGARRRLCWEGSRAATHVLDVVGGRGGECGRSVQCA